MLIIILVISIIAISIGINNDYTDWGEGLMVISGAIIMFTIAIILVMCLLFPYNIEKKLAMYEEENLKIEIKIKNTIKSYMEYEQETYDKVLKDADLTTIVLKYPELNSNELVKAEIEMYKENNNKIRELKEKQINKSVMAWWLYFGN